jgi:hypothetical protein
MLTFVPSQRTNSNLKKKVRAVDLCQQQTNISIIEADYIKLQRRRFENMCTTYWCDSLHTFIAGRTTEATYIRTWKDPRPKSFKTMRPWKIFFIHGKVLLQNHLFN